MTTPHNHELLFLRLTWKRTRVPTDRYLSLEAAAMRGKSIQPADERHLKDAREMRVILAWDRLRLGREMTDHSKGRLRSADADASANQQGAEDGMIYCVERDCVAVNRLCSLGFKGWANPRQPLLTTEAA